MATTNTDSAVLALLKTDAEILSTVGRTWTVDSLIISAAMAHEAGQMTVTERDRLVGLALRWEKSGCSR